jgi:hypothetical protein
MRACTNETVSYPITAQNIYSILKGLSKDERRGLIVEIYDKTNEESFTVSFVRQTADGKLLFVFE